MGDSMKKIIAGLTLLIGNMSIAHVTLNQKQAAEAMNARISMLKEKLDTRKSEQVQIESSIAALKKNGNNPAQLSLLMTHLSEVKSEIKSLQDELKLKMTSVRPLTTLT